MSGILRVKDLNRGHVLKQGDKTELRYGLYDADGDTPNLAGKPVEVVFMTPDFKQKATVTKTTVGDDNVVSFTIDGNLPNGKYYYEFVVGIEGNQQIYPSEHRQYFTVTPSSLESDMNVIQMVGFEELSETIIERVQVNVDVVLALVEQAEDTRKQNEENRRSNEVSRVNAESQRANNEQNRIQAEVARESRLSKLEEAKRKKYGVRRVMSATTAQLERLGDAVGLTAEADSDLTKNNVVRNDFDSIYPWSHMRKCIIEPNGRVVYEGEARYGTAIGDWMIEIPEFYWLRTNDGTVEDLWVSENPVGGHSKSEKFYVAQFKTAETDSTHISRPNHFPAVMLNRAGFREKAVAKGEGWRLMDLKARFILTLLYRVEFANLNSQQVLGNGVVSVRYTEDDLVQMAENATNRIVLLSANANNYNAGDAINIGTARVNMSGGQYRLISAINDLGNGTKEIIFDGEPINVLDNYKVYMAGQISGRTLNMLATSGTAVGSNYRSSVTYRGIEDIFGNVWEWVDGSLINDNQGYVCQNPLEYADTLTSGYLPLSYVNATSNGYVGEMGYDSNFPYADYTIDVTGGSVTKYSDYYYQNTGLRAPLVGGLFGHGVLAGLWSWALNYSPAYAALYIGARLLKTP